MVFRASKETADGGLIEWGDDNLVDIGNDRRLPATFSYSHPGGAQQPSFRFDFAVENGIPLCANVTITAKPGVPVRASDLRLVRLDDLLVSVVAAVAYVRNPDAPREWMKWHGPGGDLRFGPLNRRAAEQALARRRNRMSRDSVDLELVARTWLDAPKGGREAALMGVFGKSRSTVSRYKRDAIKAGFLTEEEGRGR